MDSIEFRKNVVMSTRTRRVILMENLGCRYIIRNTAELNQDLTPLRARSQCPIQIQKMVVEQYYVTYSNYRV
jgi:hypothetical protein